MHYVLLLTLTLNASEAKPEPPAAKTTIKAQSRSWKLFAASDKAPLTKVISSAGELAVFMGKPVSKEKEALEHAARAFKVKSIDMTKQMILVIAGEQQRTGGYSIEVTRLTNSGGKLTVAWRVKGPPPGSIVTQALTTPGIALLVDRVPGKVVFDPPVKKTGGK